MTSSIWTAQVLPKLVGKKTHATLMSKHMTNYALYLALYDAYFHINDAAMECKYLGSQKVYILLLFI